MLSLQDKNIAFTNYFLFWVFLWNIARSEAFRHKKSWSKVKINLGTLPLSHYSSYQTNIISIRSPSVLELCYHILKLIASKKCQNHCSLFENYLPWHACMTLYKNRTFYRSSSFRVLKNVLLRCRLDISVIHWLRYGNYIFEACSK